MKYFKRKCTQSINSLDVSAVLPKANSYKWELVGQMMCVRSPDSWTQNWVYQCSPTCSCNSQITLLGALWPSFTGLHRALDSLSHQQIGLQVRPNTATRCSYFISHTVNTSFSLIWCHGFLFLSS